MKIEEIVKILDAEVLAGKDNLQIEVEDCGASDLMSDVLACPKTPEGLLSGLTNLQVIRTASLSGIKMVVLVRGKRVNQSIISLAESEDIVLLLTKLSCFESCGRLYEKGLRNKGDENMET